MFLQGGSKYCNVPVFSVITTVLPLANTQSMLNLSACLCTVTQIDMHMFRTKRQQLPVQVHAS